MGHGGYGGQGRGGHGVQGRGGHRGHATDISRLKAEALQSCYLQCYQKSPDIQISMNSHTTKLFRKI